MKVTLVVTFALLLSNATMAAQSPVGTWKRLSSIVEDASGTKSDLQKQLYKAMPCSKDMTYSFLAGGKMKTTAKTCPESMQKVTSAGDVGGSWKTSGNRVIITTTTGALPPASYVVSYQANTMTWAFNYSENPKTPNPTKAKSLTIIYQRVN